MPYVIEHYKNGLRVYDTNSKPAIKQRKPVAIHADNKNIFSLLKPTSPVATPLFPPPYS